MQGYHPVLEIFIDSFIPSIAYRAFFSIYRTFYGKILCGLPVPPQPGSVLPARLTSYILVVYAKGYRRKALPAGQRAELRPPGGKGRTAVDNRTDETVRQIALRLRRIRELKGLTREKFCEPLGENYEYWGLIERGEQPISLPKLLQVCQVYYIPIETLVEPDAEPQDTAPLRQDISALLEQCTPRQLEVVRKFISDIALAL